MYEKIKELCKEQYTNITSLEKKLGFAQGTIKRWKKNTPGIDKVVLVADALDVSVDELLGRGITSTPITQSFINELTRGLSDNENLIIQKFRSLSDADKVKLLFTIMRFEGQK